MKRILIFIFVALLAVAILLMTGRLIRVSPPVINVHGSSEAAFIDRSGNLSELLNSEAIREVIITDGNHQCLIISKEHLHRFVIGRTGRKPTLEEDGVQLHLSGIRDIFVNEASDFGVYRLAGNNDAAYYSKYELVRRTVNKNQQRVAANYPADVNEKRVEQVTHFQRGIINRPVELTIEGIAADSVLFIFSNGEEEWRLTSPTGYLVVPESSLFGGNNQQNSRVLKAVWENPPAFSAHLIYDLLLKSLTEERTLALFIDGLGYKMWHYAKAKGYTDTFPEMDLKPMRVVYPPRTVYNYYMFGTGKLLQKSSVEEREIFSSLANSGKKKIIIEGDRQVYHSPVKQRLHIRPYRDADIDSLIYNSALEFLPEKDFIFIHFHDIDDTGHRYGTYSDEVMEAIRRTGSYVSEIKNRWSGNIFLFSDHGMHSYFDENRGVYAGTHFKANSEDMIAVFGQIVGKGSTRGEIYEQ